MKHLCVRTEICAHSPAALSHKVQAFSLVLSRSIRGPKTLKALMAQPTDAKILHSRTRYAHSCDRAWKQCEKTIKKGMKPGNNITKTTKTEVWHPTRLSHGQYVYIDCPVGAISAAEWLVRKSYSRLNPFIRGPLEITDEFPSTPTIYGNWIQKNVSVNHETLAPSLNNTRYLIDCVNTHIQNELQTDAIRYKLQLQLQWNRM